MWSKLSFLRWVGRVRAAGKPKGYPARRLPLHVEGLEDRSVPTTFSALNPQTALAAQLELAGPMARAGFDLSYLYRDYLSFTATAGTSPAGYQPTSSLLQISGSSVAVDALTQNNVTATRADLEALGFRTVAQGSWVVSGYLPITSLEAAAGLASVRAIEPEYKPITSVGSVTSQGAQAVGSDLVNNFLGFDGTGVTVGVLSDSYDALGGADADIASGDLPGPGNPLGHTTPVDVIQDAAAGTDEGRAMLQIVHDVAPGASLAFATAGTTQAQFAANIVALANAGANVLVDDFTFLTEPMFQDGLVAQAVDQVVAGGASYFSAAGNNGRASYEQAFRNSGVNLGTGGTGQVTTDTTFVAHNFDPTPGNTDLFQTITLPPGTTSFSFQWADPFFSVDGPSGGGAQTDLDIAVFDTAGNFLDTLGGFTRNSGGDPVEVFTIDNPNATPMQVRLAIGKVSGPDPALMKYVAFGPGTAAVTINDFPTDSSTVFGHANAAGAEAVGAALYSETPAFGQSPPLLEPYSGRGGTPILYDINGNQLPAPQVRQTVDLVAPDGVNTTFFGQPDPTGTGPFEADGFPNFFGTSAAAPHAAGVAALLLQAKPGLAPAQVYGTLESTAIDMGPAGYDRDSGWGLVRATTASLTGPGPYTVTFDGSSGDDSMLVRRDSSGVNIEFWLNGVRQLSLPADQVTDIRANGLDGNDTLTVDNSNGPVGEPIGYDGGTGTDTLAVIGVPGGIDAYADTAGNLTVAAGGSPPVALVSVEVMNLTPGSGVVNLLGDDNGPTGQDDTFVVRGTGPGAFTASINGSPAVQFAGVTALNVSGRVMTDTLDISPWASNGPAGWGVQTYYDGGTPGGADLLVYNTVAANPVSEDIAVQPAGPGAGELRVNNAADGSAVAVISFTNTDLSVNDTDGFTTDTDSLTLRGTADPDAFVIDLAAAGTAADPVADVVEGEVGPTRYRVRSFAGFRTLGIAGLGGSDTVQLVAGRDDGGVALAVDLGLPSGGQLAPDRILAYGTDGGDDSFRYAPGATPDAGRLEVTRAAASAPTVVDFAGVEGITFDGGPVGALTGGPGADHVILDGTNGADAFQLSTPFPATVAGQVGAGPALTFQHLGSGGSTFALNGLGGDDTFAVAGLGGLGIGGVAVDGGGGADEFDLAGTAFDDLFTFTPSTGLLAAGAPGGGAVPYTLTGIEAVGIDALGQVLGDRLAVTEPVTFSPTPGSGTVPTTPPLSYQNVELFTIDQLPEAVDDAATTPEGTLATIDVLANDLGIGDAPLTLAIESPPPHGSAVVIGGKVRYTPDPDFTTAAGGPDAFTYRVTDANGQSSTGTVAVTVTPVNHRPVIFPQAVTTPEDTPLAIALTADDGDPGVVQALTFTILTPPAHGRLTRFDPAAGTLTYVPDPDYNGPDFFTVAVADDATAGGPALTSAPASVSVGVTPVNDPPTANPDAYTVAAGHTLTIPAPGVLGNDTDPDGDPLTASLGLNPGVFFTTVGTVSVNPDGSFRFTPVRGFTGTASFVYRADDGHGGTSEATVTITVTPAPAIIATGAGAGGGPQVEVFDAKTGALKFSFYAYDPSFTGGVRVAVGDVNGDGIPDIITGAGVGGFPNVKVFSGKDLTLLASFFAFDDAFTGGVSVAAGDVDGDGVDEVVVGAGPGAGPHVRTFEIGNGGAVQLAGPLGSFYAYEPAFTGGVNVAVGDYNGDGRGEIITGAASLGGPRVEVFAADGSVLANFFAFASPVLGVSVAAADLDGDGKAEIITGPGDGGGPVPQIFAGGTAAPEGAFLAMAPDFRGGIAVGVADANGDGKPDLLVSSEQDSGAVQVFDGRTLALLDRFDAYDDIFSGGVFVAGT